MKPSVAGYIVKSVRYYVATNGDLIAADSPETYTYGGPGSANDTIVKTDIATGSLYKKTFTFSGSSLASDSGWVKQ